MFDVSLNGILEQMLRHKIVLPAMQRPFVWREDRITKFIDSMLRDFPLGTAMIWRTDSLQRYRPFKAEVFSEATFTTDFEKNKSEELYLVLDGQQRLTSLLVAIHGTYDNKRLYIDVLSGERGEKDPGECYWDCRFLTEKEAEELNRQAINGNNQSEDKTKLFILFSHLTSLKPKEAGQKALQKAASIKLDKKETDKMVASFLQCSSVLYSKSPLHIHSLDADIGKEGTPLDEILEIFVRVNSGGLVLQKSDLLMSLLDLTWNDIQPEIFQAVKRINEHRPFKITRDDVLKSLLLASNSESRFDRLVQDRDKVAKLGKKLPQLLPQVEKAWKHLTTILVDDCKISSERFLRGGHNSLLPFVIFIMSNEKVKLAEKRRMVVGIYAAIMSGIFAGAEARMGAFARNECLGNAIFPLEKLIELLSWQYGIFSLDDLLSRHLDLTLNIAHGGISLDNNPDNLQRDHIFPRSTLLNEGVSEERANHYANFHFLRASDNLNKSNIPPHRWFKKPGDQPAYTDEDLNSRLLTLEMIKPGKFKKMITERSRLIQEKALQLFNMNEAQFGALFPEEDDEE